MYPYFERRRLTEVILLSFGARYDGLGFAISFHHLHAWLIDMVETFQVPGNIEQPPLSLCARIIQPRADKGNNTAVRLPGFQAHLFVISRTWDSETFSQVKQLRKV